MRITVLCPHFAPDTAPTGEVMTRLVHELAAQGHELHVVTSLPWYHQHAVEPEWRGRLVRREKTEWGRITRVHPFASKDKTNLVLRAAAFAVFTSVSTLVGCLTRRTDAVLAMSPPLTLGPAGWIVALRMRCPLVFNIQDVYPDAAVETGAITSSRVIQVLRWLERFSYSRAAAVTVLSEDLAENVRQRVDDEAKVRVIPNFVDTERIVPLDRRTAYRAELGIGNQIVVMYAGNMGYSQPLEMIVESARRLSHRSDVHFLINGDGARRPEIEREAEALDNLTVVGLQPRERVPEVLATGDIHLVLLREGLAKVSVPSKMYSILAAGRPVLASVDTGSEVDRVVGRTGAGRAVAPGDVDALVAAVEHFVDEPLSRIAAGDSGRAFAETWLSPASVGAAYGDLLEELRATKQ
ncbi:MAG: colanic acid biosynthesis glycosyl transferase WcaI [Candidatus Poriferisodalaceae bacterium]|jgi:colanic acid biosynthesis glycosyl transferase WcaI